MSTTSQHPYATGTRWLKRLLSGQPHQIIGDGTPYMLRWYVIPRNPILNIYVHKFLRSDDDRALHDHPWWFVSLVLRGGYVEQTEHGLIARRPGTLAVRKAEHRHIVQLQPDSAYEAEIPAWTLIVTGPKVREWGFWCKQTLMTMSGRHVQHERFVPWREWGDGGCGETS